MFRKFKDVNRELRNSDMKCNKILDCVRREFAIQKFAHYFGVDRKQLIDFRMPNQCQSVCSCGKVIKLRIYPRLKALEASDVDLRACY